MTQTGSAQALPYSPEPLTFEEKLSDLIADHLQHDHPDLAEVTRRLAEVAEVLGLVRGPF